MIKLKSIKSLPRKLPANCNILIRIIVLDLIDHKKNNLSRINFFKFSLKLLNISLAILIR